MKTLSRTLLFTSLVIILGACDPTDPFDRIQGEPSEEDGVAVIDTDEGSDTVGETPEGESAEESEEAH